ncbi:MAG: redoxin domain-containing protein [Nitrospiraceae bacterium]
MALRLGDEAPNFTAETTEGKITFHEWLGSNWGILFSHPKDYTPVCTTELGYMARIKGEFEKRGVKVLAISVDPLEDHRGWTKDINETQNCTVSYPLIADPEKKVAMLYDMIHPNALDNMTVRSVFVIGPDKKIKPMLTYPASCGRNFDELLRVVGQPPIDGEVQGGDAGQLEGWTGLHHHPAVSDVSQDAVPEGVQVREAVSPSHPAAEQVAVDFLKSGESGDRLAPRLFLPSNTEPSKWHQPHLTGLFQPSVSQNRKRPPASSGKPTAEVRRAVGTPGRPCFRFGVASCTRPASHSAFSEATTHSSLPTSWEE